MKRKQNFCQAGETIIAAAGLCNVAAGGCTFTGAHPGLSAIVTGGAGVAAVTVAVDLTAATYVVIATSQTSGCYVCAVRTDLHTITLRQYLNDGTPTDGAVNLSIFKVGEQAGDSPILAAGRVNVAVGGTTFTGAHPGITAASTSTAGLSALTVGLDLTAEDVVILATSETATLTCSASDGGTAHTISTRQKTDGGVATDGVLDIIVLAR